MCLHIVHHCTQCETRQIVTLARNPHQDHNDHSLDFDIYHPFQEPGRCAHYVEILSIKETLACRQHGTCCRQQLYHVCDKLVHEGQLKCMGTKLTAHIINSQEPPDDLKNWKYSGDIRNPLHEQIDHDGGIFVALDKYLEISAKIRRAMNSLNIEYPGLVEKDEIKPLLLESFPRLVGEWEAACKGWETSSASFLVESQDSMTNFQRKKLKIRAFTPHWMQEFIAPLVASESDQDTIESLESCDDNGMARPNPGSGGWDEVEDFKQVGPGNKDTSSEEPLAGVIDSTVLNDDGDEDTVDLQHKDNPNHRACHASSNESHQSGPDNKEQDNTGKGTDGGDEGGQQSQDPGHSGGNDETAGDEDTADDNACGGNAGDGDDDKGSHHSQDSVPVTSEHGQDEEDEEEEKQEEGGEKTSDQPENNNKPGAPNSTSTGVDASDPIASTTSPRPSKVIEPPYNPSSIASSDGEAEGHVTQTFEHVDDFPLGADSEFTSDVPAPLASAEQGVESSNQPSSEDTSNGEAEDHIAAPYEGVENLDLGLDSEIPSDAPTSPAPLVQGTGVSGLPSFTASSEREAEDHVAEPYEGEKDIDLESDSLGPFNDSQDKVEGDVRGSEAKVDQDESPSNTVDPGVDGDDDKVQNEIDEDAAEITDASTSDVQPDISNSGKDESACISLEENAESNKSGLDRASNEKAGGDTDEKEHGPSNPPSSKSDHADDVEAPDIDFDGISGDDLFGDELFGDDLFGDDLIGDDLFGEEDATGTHSDAQPEDNVDKIQNSDAGEEPSIDANYDAPELNACVDHNNQNNMINWPDGSERSSADPANESSSGSEAYVPPIWKRHGFGQPSEPSGDSESGSGDNNQDVPPPPPRAQPNTSSQIPRMGHHPLEMPFPESLAAQNPVDEEESFSTDSEGLSLHTDDRLPTDADDPPPRRSLSFTGGGPAIESNSPTEDPLTREDEPAAEDESVAEFDPVTEDDLVPGGSSPDRDEPIESVPELTDGHSAYSDDEPESVSSGYGYNPSFVGSPPPPPFEEWENNPIAEGPLSDIAIFEDGGTQSDVTSNINDYDRHGEDDSTDILEDGAQDLGHSDPLNFDETSMDENTYVDENENDDFISGYAERYAAGMASPPPIPIEMSEDRAISVDTNISDTPQAFELPLPLVRADEMTREHPRFIRVRWNGPSVSVAGTPADDMFISPRNTSARDMFGRHWQGDNHDLVDGPDPAELEAAAQRFVVDSQELAGSGSDLPDYESPDDDDPLQQPSSFIRQDRRNARASAGSIAAVALLNGTASQREDEVLQQSAPSGVASERNATSSSSSSSQSSSSSSSSEQDEDDIDDDETPPEPPPPSGSSNDDDDCGPRTPENPPPPPPPGAGACSAKAEVAVIDDSDPEDSGHLPLQIGNYAVYVPVTGVPDIPETRGKKRKASRLDSVLLETMPRREKARKYTGSLSHSDACGSGTFAGSSSSSSGSYGDQEENDPASEVSDVNVSVTYMSLISQIPNSSESGGSKRKADGDGEDERSMSPPSRPRKLRRLSGQTGERCTGVDSDSSISSENSSSTSNKSSDEDAEVSFAPAPEAKELANSSSQEENSSLIVSSTVLEDTSSSMFDTSSGEDDTAVSSSSEPRGTKRKASALEVSSGDDEEDDDDDEPLSPIPKEWKLRRLSMQLRAMGSKVVQKRRRFY